MKYYELKIFLFLQKDLSVNSIYNALSKFVFEGLHDKDRWSKWHFENHFKHYVFNKLYNKEIDLKKYNFTYPKNNSFMFTLRSFSFEFVNYLKENLQNVNNRYFKFIKADMQTKKQFFINEIISKNPVIVTKYRKSWTIETNGDILELQNILHNNLVKKYNEIFEEKINPEFNFIQYFEILNRKPQKVVIEKNSKKITFLGNSLKIIPHDDIISQRLAFLAIGAGLGEKNSYGCGYCEGE